jgi:hypothetical protein
MDFSIVVARVLEIFFVVIGISMVANGKTTAAAVEEPVLCSALFYSPDKQQ